MRHQKIVSETDTEQKRGYVSRETSAFAGMSQKLGSGRAPHTASCFVGKAQPRQRSDCPDAVRIGQDPDQIESHQRHHWL